MKDCTFTIPCEKGYVRIVRELGCSMQQLLGVSVDARSHTSLALRRICQWAMAIQVRDCYDPKPIIDLLKETGDAPADFKQQAKAILCRHLGCLIREQKPREVELLAAEMKTIWPQDSGVEGQIGRFFYLQGDLDHACDWFEQVPDWTLEPAHRALAYYLLLVETRSPEVVQSCFLKMAPIKSPESLDDALSALLLNLLIAPTIDGISERFREIHRSFSTSQAPRILALTHPFSRNLLQRMEAFDQPEWYNQAADVLVKAIQVEYEFVPCHGDACVTLARWLLLTGKQQEAWNIVERETMIDETFTSGFAYLALFAWIYGFLSYAREALERLDVTTSARPAQLFARWVACAVNGDLERSIICMERLFHQAPAFFLDHPGVTVWGMLSLALKAMGHEALSSQAWQLGEKQDPLNHFRAHLLERVQVPVGSYPLSPFTWPEALL